MKIFSVASCCIPLALFCDEFAHAFHVPQSSTKASQAAVTSSLFRSPLKAATIDNVDKIESEVESSAEEFDWFKAWYPLAPVAILDKDKPHKFELLGMELVIWNDAKRNDGEFGEKPKKKRKRSIEGDGTWRAFLDECPHRKVPLSEGRVENDGTLLCSYHGWRFEGEEGKCIDIPQLSDKEQIEAISQNPKSSCNSFPTKIINGILFVWASSGKDANLESELTPVTHRPADGEEAWAGPWNYRELPYGHDFFQENVVDPAHVTVSHHNVVGNRYDDQTQTLSPIDPLTKDGFSFSVSAPGRPPSRTEFHAPCLVTPISEVEGAKQILELYSSPSRPGFCNHVGRMVIVKTDKDAELPIGLKQFTLPVPTWVNHLMASAFLNQDALFLHHQERHMHKSKLYSTLKPDNEEMQAYSKAVYPVQSDLGVMNYRKWISKFAGGGIPYKNNPQMPIDSSNEIVFDVWNGHTKHCKYCQDAERQIKKFRKASFIFAAFVGVL